MILPWTTSSFMGLLTASLTGKIFWLQLGHAGTSYVTIFWLVLVFEYLGWVALTRPRIVVLLSIMPTIGIVLALSYPHHQVYWYDFTINSNGLVEFERGWFLLLRNLYFYILGLLTSILTIARLFQTTKYFRPQAILLAIAPLPVIFTNIIYILGLTNGVDITTFGYGITGIILGIGTLGYEILTVIPIARNQVMQKIQIGVFTVDTQNRILDVNKSAAAILGYSEQELLGHSVFNFFNESMQILVQEIDKLSLNQDYHEEIMFNDLIYDLQVTSLVDHNQKIIGRVVVFFDITNRKQTEIALAEREKSAHEFQEYLQLLHKIRVQLSDYETLDEIYQQIITIGLEQLGFDRMGLFIIENDFVLGTYGTDADGQISDESNYRSNLTKHQKMKHVLESEDYVSLWTDTELIFYDENIGKGWNAIAALWDGNQAIGFIAVDNLITHYQPRGYESQLLSAYANILTQAITSKQAELQQQILINELEAFAHTVAHDLKNPLSVIHSFSALMLEDKDQLTGDFEKFTTVTYNTSKKMFGIIDELLTLAEIRHRSEILLNPLNTASIIRESQQRLAQMIETTEAKIILPETWESAFGYSPWVEQIWVNYLSNALKYSGTPPIIELGSEKLDNDFVKFWMKDNGAGIPPDKLLSLFSQFTRLAENRATGHGLGLSIVKRIVEKLGGEVGAESQLGQGCTFYFTLPSSPLDNSKSNKMG